MTVALRAKYARVGTGRATALMGGRVAPPYTTVGLTAYWDTTAQNGSEAFIPDVVGWLNAVHSGAPAWNPARRLWTYPGVHSVFSRTPTAVAALGTPSGRWTVEFVYALLATAPNFGHVAGITINGSAGDLYFQHSSLTREAKYADSASGLRTIDCGTTTIGALQHIFVVADGAAFTVYLNNLLVAGPVAGSAPPQAAAQVGFGDRPGATAPAACDAGWLRYYADKALSAAERAANYAHAKFLFPELP